MSGDPTFWKDLYKELWGAGANRVEIVIKLLDEEKIDISANADDALSEEYIFETEHEKGEADLKVNNTNILIEVTGTNVPSVKPEYGLWFRPDKFGYAENHPESEVWAVHVLDHKEVIRAIKLEKGSKDRYKTVHPRIRGVLETYKEVPANDEYLLSFEDFCEYLKKRIEEIKNESERSKE